MSASKAYSLVRLVLPPLLLIAAVTGCTTKTGTDSSHSAPTTLTSSPLRLDPCSAVPADQWRSLELEVRKANDYQGPFSDPRIEFKGCRMQYLGTPGAEFYLEATNMTADYPRKLFSDIDTFQQIKIADHDATVADTIKYPGQCRVLVSMSDYQLMLDGSFPNRSCTLAIEIATKLVALPQLQ